MHPVTFVHTSDVHIGKTFGSLGSKGKAQRDQIKKTFSDVVDLALEKQATGLLIAGDLFDSHSVSELDFSFVISELKRLSNEGIYSFLIAGNHDFLQEGSVYYDSRFEDEYIVVFTEELRSYEIASAGVTICGASLTSRTSKESPFSRIERTGERSIALIHGAYAIPERHDVDSSPFTLEEIEASGFDYVACGDWHSFLELPSENVKAIYSGSPEALSFGQGGSGYVSVVQLESQGVSVEKVKVGKRDFALLELDVTAQEQVFDFIAKSLRDVAGADVICNVVLNGMVSPEMVVSEQKLLDEFGEMFFALRIVDKTDVALDSIVVSDYPEDLVIGRFVRNMISKIEQSEGEDRDVLEKALQIGIQKLSGK